MKKLSIAFNITSGQLAVNLTMKVYNAWCVWHQDKNDAKLLASLCSAYEQARNLALDSSWQTDNHDVVSSHETKLFLNSASPLKDMHCHL